MLKYMYLIVVIAAIIAVITYGPPRSNSSTLIHTTPPIQGEMIILGDNIYFLNDIGSLAKHNKGDLSPVSHLYYPDLLNITYSGYLDKIIFHAGWDPSNIVMVDYQNMSIVNNITFDGHVGHVATSNDKLYIAWDNSGIQLGDNLNTELPHNLGVISQMDLDSFTIDWEVNVGTLPTYIIDAGDFVATTGLEIVSGEGGGGVAGLLSVVEKNTLEVRQFNIGIKPSVLLYSDEFNKIIICNVYGYSNRDMTDTSGLSVLDLNTWTIEHVIIPNPFNEEWAFKASGACIQNGTLYVAYLNSKQDGKTYFGKYDLATEAMETVELPGVTQFLKYNAIDGNNIYFSTEDGWLIKYALP